MNYLLWGLYIQHSATLGVFLLESKEEKIVFPEGSLHNLCVSISVQLRCQNMTGTPSFS